MVSLVKIYMYYYFEFNFLSYYSAKAILIWSQHYKMNFCVCKATDFSIIRKLKCLSLISRVTNFRQTKHRIRFKSNTGKNIEPNS